MKQTKRKRSVCNCTTRMKAQQKVYSSSMIWKEKAMTFRLLRFVNQLVDCFANNKNVVSSILTGAPFDRKRNLSLIFFAIPKDIETITSIRTKKNRMILFLVQSNNTTCIKSQDQSDAIFFVKQVSSDFVQKTRRTTSMIHSSVT